MLTDFFRWLGQNVGSLLLAFILSVVVWITAQVSEDPNEQRVFPRNIPLQLVGRDADLFVYGDIPDTVRVTLYAPQSVWTRLTNNPDSVEAWIDISGLEPGTTHVVPVEVHVDARAVRVVQVQPESVKVTLERLASRTLPVQVRVEGQPPLGYRTSTPSVSPEEVLIIGPESLVEQVAMVRATIDISGARETREATVPLEALNQDGEVITDVNISPRSVTVTSPISLQESFKNVAVRVVRTGQLAPGFRLTNIQVSPQVVTVYSEDPELVNRLPGYVETEPINLSGLSDDVEMRVALNLPEGVELVERESVLVQFSIAAIEDSITVSIPVEVLGLSPDLQARISPAEIDVIVIGPLPVLDGLNDESFRAVVDLRDLGVGTYQLTPEIDLVPDQVRVLSITPDIVEVLVEPAAAPTPGAGSTFSGSRGTTVVP